MAADRRTATVTARVSAAELADWRAKATPAAVSLPALLRQAMARTRTWTAPATEVERERTRQIARIGNNLNQLARWASGLPKVRITAGDHVSSIRAVRSATLAVGPHLMSPCRDSGKKGVGWRESPPSSQVAKSLRELESRRYFAEDLVDPLAVFVRNFVARSHMHAKPQLGRADCGE